MAHEELRAELERLYELNELEQLSRDLLGFEPAQIGGSAAKASFAKALVEYCVAEQAIAALADAVVAQRGDDARRFGELRANGFASHEEFGKFSMFGPFQILHKIGEGSAGICYAARYAE